MYGKDPLYLRENLPSTIVELVCSQSIHRPNQRIFTFLHNGEREEGYLTYQQLDMRARAIAATLQQQNLTGRRALLLFAPGKDYIATFYACLYAGVVAIPAYPPRNARTITRINTIIADADAAVALTSNATLPKLQALLGQRIENANVKWICTDEIDDADSRLWVAPAIESNSLALLQYTSGSTGRPKGVMLSHANLLSNADYIIRTTGCTPATVAVSWLPPYHDMGLIGGVLTPVYGGYHNVSMTPAAFSQYPYRWLHAMSEYKGSFTGGPNFAYELCMRRITRKQRNQLDLSHWTVAVNGAEPVRASTLREFTAYFRASGLRRNVFFPCYGLAEGTLIVSAATQQTELTSKHFKLVALEQNQVVEVASSTKYCKELVSCGNSMPGQQVIIVNPMTKQLCAPHEVGEIWVAGPSIARGYWNNVELTRENFQMRISGDEQALYLRTGDLGFMHAGELFVTGRLNDIIALQGRNLYPQDIEAVVEQSHRSIRANACAAFRFEVDHAPRLVIMFELNYRVKDHLQQIFKAVRNAVINQCHVQPYSLVLLKTGGLPLTSSGKIRRWLCRVNFKENNYVSVAEWLERPRKFDSDQFNTPVQNLESLKTEQLFRQFNNRNAV